MATANTARVTKSNGVDTAAAQAAFRAKYKADQARKATAQTETVEDSETLHDEPQSGLFENMSLASSTRKLLAWGCWVFSFAGVASAGIHLVNYAILGALLLTGSSFLAMMIYLIGMVLTIYAAFIAGNEALCYVVSSKPEQHWALVKQGASKVRGWLSFGKKDEPIVPASAH